MLFFPVLFEAPTEANGAPDPEAGAVPGPGTPAGPGVWDPRDGWVGGMELCRILLVGLCFILFLFHEDLNKARSK